MARQTAASLQCNWCQLREILADEVAVGRSHKDSRIIPVLFIEDLIFVECLVGLSCETETNLNYSLRHDTMGPIGDPPSPLKVRQKSSSFFSHRQDCQS